MGINGIAEAIILQCIEDLWDEDLRAESVEFFSSEGFYLCSKMAGMGTLEKQKLIGFIERVKHLTDSDFKRPDFKRSGKEERVSVKAGALMF